MIPDITYSVSAADLQALVEHEQATTYRSAALRRRLLGSLYVGAALYAMTFFMTHHHIASACVAIPVTLLYLYAIPGVERDQQAKALKKLFTTGSDTALGPQKLSFSDDALIASNASSESRLSWSAFQRLAVTNTHVFLVLGPVKALTIPLAQVPAEQHAELLAFLRTRIIQHPPGSGAA